MWALGDQGISSITNFSVAVVAAHLLSPTAFGVYGLSFFVYVAVLALARGCVTEPLLLRFSAQSSDRVRENAGSVLGAALHVGICAGAIIASASFIPGVTTFRPGLLALAVSLPALLVQDAVRYIHFAEGNPRSAFLNDTVWLAGQSLLLVMIAFAISPSVASVMFAMGFGALCGAVLGAARLRSRPSLGQGWRWLASNSAIGRRLAADFLASTGGRPLAMILIAGLVSSEAIGGIRGAQTVLGPVTMLDLVVGLVVVPEGVRALRREPGRVKWLVDRASLAVSATALLWGALWLFVPREWGEAVLGDVWVHARPIIVPLAVLQAANAVCASHSAGLRILSAISRAVKLRIALAISVVAAAVVGAWVGGAVGATIGQACVAGVGCLFYMGAFAAAFREMKLRPVALEPAHSV